MLQGRRPESEGAAAATAEATAACQRGAAAVWERGALIGGDGHRTTGTAAGGGGAGWFGGGAAAGYYCAGGGGSSYVDEARCTLVKHIDGEVGSGVPSSIGAAPDHPSAQRDSDYVSGVAVTGLKREQAGHGLVVIYADDM